MYSFIATAQFNGHPFNQTTLSTGNLSVSNADTVIVAFLSQDAGPFTVTGQTGDTYSSAGGVNNLHVYYCVSATVGTYALTASGGSHIYQIGALQYRGLSAFQNASFQQQNSPGTGNNVVSSTTAVCTAAPAMVLGFAVDVQNVLNDPPAATTLSAGTSPLAFTGEGGMWPELGSFTCALPEDARVTSTGSYAATFGITTNNETYAGVLIFTETATGTTLTPGAGSDNFTGNAPTVTPATNNVVTPFVARKSGVLEPDRRLFVPSRKIFLPPWVKRAA